MGYTAAGSAADRTCYYRRTTGLFHWKENAIAITVTEHAITVGGPIFTLRMLQQKLIG